MVYRNKLLYLSYTIVINSKTKIEMRIYTKQMIAEELKKVVVTVKVRKGYDDEVAYKPYGSIIKGVRGGSVGPMTSTNVHEKHNNDSATTIDVVFGSMSFKKVKERNQLVFCIATSEKKCRVLTFTLVSYPTHSATRNMDPAYKTYWYVLSVADKNIDDVK